MPETMQNESPKHQNVVNTRGKPGKYNANANRHEIQKKFPKRKKKKSQINYGPYIYHIKNIAAIRVVKICAIFP